MSPSETHEEQRTLLWNPTVPPPSSYLTQGQVGGGGTAHTPVFSCRLVDEEPPPGVPTISDLPSV